MAKLGCAKCGGTKKMKLGGSAVAKAPVNIYGIPQENMGTSSQMGFGRKGGSVKEHPITAFRKANETRQEVVKKSLPKAQLGSIVKAFTKFAKPVAKNIIKDTKVVVRPINRSAKPIAKKLDRKSADRFIINQNLAKLSKEDDIVSKKALKIATAVGAAPIIGAGVKGLINKPKDTSKAKVKPKKK